MEVVGTRSQRAPDDRRHLQLPVVVSLTELHLEFALQDSSFLFCEIDLVTLWFQTRVELLHLRVEVSLPFRDLGFPIVVMSLLAKTLLFEIGLATSISAFDADDSEHQHTTDDFGGQDDPAVEPAESGPDAGKLLHGAFLHVTVGAHQ